MLQPPYFVNVQLLPLVNSMCLDAPYTLSSDGKLHGTRVTLTQHVYTFVAILKKNSRQNGKYMKMHEKTLKKCTLVFAPKPCHTSKIPFNPCDGICTHG